MKAVRQKVLHVIPGLLRAGAENMLTALVTANSPDRPQAIVVNMLEGGANAAIIRRAAIPLHELGMKRGRPSVGSTLRLASIIRTEKPDAVQGWMYYGDLLATLGVILSGRRRLTRLYWGVRCSEVDLSQYGWAQRFSIRACASLSSIPDGVVANSQAGRTAHMTLGYHPRRFLVIPNGIDSRRFRPDSDARFRVRSELGLAADASVVLLPARVHPMKDHANFLAALELAPGVYGLAVGCGTEGLPDCPGLLRLGPRDDMPKLCAASDIVVSSSCSEGFSNAVAEGMAAGCPAVVTDVGDSRAIVGDTGIVVPPRDPGALAKAITRLLAKLDAAPNELRRRARERICREYSLERAVATFDSLHTTGAKGPGEDN